MKLRLRGKYTLFIVSLIVINILLITGISVIQFRSLSGDFTHISSRLMSQGLMKEMEATGSELTKLLAENLINPLYHYDMDAIYKILADYKELHNVNTIHVFDTDNRIVHDGAEDNTKFGNPLNDVFYANKTIKDRKSLLRLQKNTLEIYHPIILGDTVLGGVRVVFSLDEIHKEIGSLNQELDGIGAAGLKKSNHWYLPAVSMSRSSNFQRLYFRD